MSRFIAAYRAVYAPVLVVYNEAFYVSNLWTNRWFMPILLKIPITMKPEDNPTDSVDGALQIDIGMFTL